MMGNWYNSLQALIPLLLTIALLPLGAVAIYQTNQVATEAQRNIQLALLALTEQAANTEEVVIQRAIGTASFVASLAPSLAGSSDRCIAYLSDFLAAQEDFSFIGILPASGIMTCSSTGEMFDFSQYPDFENNMETRLRTIQINADAPMSGRSVFLVSEPFEVNGAFGGYVFVSVPHDGLRAVSDELEQMGLVDLITFNPRGVLVTARAGLAQATNMLPQNRSIDTLMDLQGSAFEGTSLAGQQRVYTVVSIQGSPAAVLGVWRVSSGAALPSINTLRATIFPVLMWLASMAVAMMSIYLLVLRNLSRMRQSMDVFAETRMISPPLPHKIMPKELQALQRNFDRMADDIIREEAAMEDAVREKNVLIKEVHHRVKNNLQLISSVMNMQIRKAKHAETKLALSRLQDRVLSLATIHRDLYQSHDRGMIEVSALLTEIVDRSNEVACEVHQALSITTDIEHTLLYPDQAVPLSLLAAEAMINAAKYVSVAANEKPWIMVSFKSDGDLLRLVIANSCGGGDIAIEENEGTGSQLMHAFAIQLGGEISFAAELDSYSLTVTFMGQQFLPDERDF